MNACSYCRQRQPTETPCVACPSQKPTESVEPRLEAVCQADQAYRAAMNESPASSCPKCVKGFSGPCTCDPSEFSPASPSAWAQFGETLRELRKKHYAEWNKLAFDFQLDPMATSKATMNVHRFPGGMVLQKVAAVPTVQKPDCAHPNITNRIAGDGVACSDCGAVVTGQEFAYARSMMATSETSSRVFTMALASKASQPPTMPVLYAENYGAKGDGIHDDLPALQAAFAAAEALGGAIIRVSGPITLAARTQPETDQRTIDANRWAMAQEIVDAQPLETIDDARRFAKAWIETAAQHAANEEYWEKRAREAENRLVSAGINATTG